MHTPIIMMFTSMFIIQYVFMSYIMTNQVDNITNSMGKVYMSTIMGLLMIIIMSYNNIQNLGIYICLLIICIYLYKIQFGVNDKNYIREMIEHHSMALLTSKQIIKKTDNSYVADIAQRIINTQESEIQEMRNIINLI
jgi:hypothetical protein